LSVLHILLLDDNQHRITFFQNGLKQHKLTVCRHARAAIKALKDHSFDLIFLDHDLDRKAADPEDENSGSEVARYIADHQVEYRCVILHTENRVGREAMQAILGDYLTMPYGKLKKSGFPAVLKLALWENTA
jgi:CheY-like chemotaxis protein